MTYIIYVHNVICHFCNFLSLLLLPYIQFVMDTIQEMLYVEVWCTYAEMEVDMSKSGAMILNQ